MMPYSAPVVTNQEHAIAFTGTSFINRLWVVLCALSFKLMFEIIISDKVVNTAGSP
jgi:hypothetical protein